MNEQKQVIDKIMNEISKIQYNEFSYGSFVQKICQLENFTGIAQSVIHDDLRSLSNHFVIEITVKPLPTGQTIKKLPKLQEYIDAGGFYEYQGKQKIKAEQESKIKNLTLSDLETRVKYVERQYNDQRNYWYVALAIAFLALIISLMTSLKK